MHKQKDRRGELKLQDRVDDRMGAAMDWKQGNGIIRDNVGPEAKTD